MSFSDQMLAKLEALLLANVGATSVTVDGASVSYADLEAKYQFWKNKVARESGDRPFASQIKLG